MKFILSLHLIGFAAASGRPSSAIDTLTTTMVYMPSDTTLTSSILTATSSCIPFSANACPTPFNTCCPYLCAEAQVPFLVCQTTSATFLASCNPCSPPTSTASNSTLLTTTNISGPPFTNYSRVTPCFTPASSISATASPTRTGIHISPSTTAAKEFASSTSAPPCPTDISSSHYIAPNLIIPVSPASPDHAFGTQYTATITPENSTVFLFDIPYSYTGTCALIFQFPFSNHAQFPYTFSGIEEEEGHHGGLHHTLLDGEVNEKLTFNTLPPIKVDHGTSEVFPGNNYTVAKGPCASGKRVAYEVSSVGGVVLEFFENVADSPIGAFVVPCA